MRETRNYFTTPTELFQYLTRQPFAETPDPSVTSGAAELEKALSFYSQGRQFVYVYDYKVGGMAFVSGNIREVLGYAPEAVCTEFFYKKMHPQDLDQILKISDAASHLALEHKEIAPLTLFLTVDCRMQHAQGHYLKMQRQTSILQRDAQGNIRYSLGTFTDISHLNRGDAVTFDVNMPEYKEKLMNILASYDVSFTSGEFSQRERQVLRLMARGKNTRQIAQELSLSNFTVDTHRKNMKKKLKARNTAELITAAFARQLI